MTNVPQAVINLTNAIKGLIVEHYNITGSSLQKGHVKAGGTPQTIGQSLSAGTDNGYYARADHVHTASYNNLTDKPSIPTKTSDLTNDSNFLTQHQSLNNYYTKTEIDELIGDIEEDMLS